MNKIFKFFVALPAILFVFMGVRWGINPESAAQAQFMPLLEGMALSSQIADLGALFLGMGLMIFFALITGNKSWLQAVILLLLSIAVMRVIAWLFHGAALAIPMIVIELLVSGLLAWASKSLPKGSESIHKKEAGL